MRRLLFVLCLIIVACGENPTAPITPVVSVTVSPPAVVLVIGDTTSVTAVARDSAGDSLAGKPISWRSSDTTIAVVSSTGLVRARARGTAQVTAVSEGKFGFSTAYVVRPPTQLVVILMFGDTVYTGDSTALLTTALDSAGEASLVESVTWSVVDPTIIHARPIQNDVWLKGLKPGVTWVTARSGSLSDSVRIWVRNRVGSIAIAPDTGVFLVGDSLQLGATVRDSAGNLLDDRPVTWQIAFGPASIDTNGMLRSHGAGLVRVTAQSESASDTGKFDMMISGRFVEIAAGTEHTCGVTTTGKAYCWGHGDYGQLGRGGGAQGGARTPSLVIGGHSFSRIRSGYYHGCGLTASGAAYCWGMAGFGALGSLPPTEFCIYGEYCVGTPLLVQGGHSFQDVSIGHRRLCGRESTTLYCWGWNDVGQLGVGTSDNNDHPLPEAVIGGLAASDLSAGSRHACAIANGVVYCWGDNQHGRLGRGTVDTSIVAYPTPDTIVGGHRFTSLSTGSYHNCAIAADSSAFCWGVNDAGQLGSGAAGPPIPSPVLVAGGLKFSSVRVGEDYTCAIAVDSLAYCWGRNNSGELGDGTTTQRLSPTPVAGGMRFTQLTAQRVTCGVANTGIAYCWGNNGIGQLGIGGFGQIQTVPAPVVGQQP